MVRKNTDYYDHRTSHGSTLSFIAHAGILAALDPESSWERYMVALESDIGDVQGGTTQEGIHMGVMAGTLDLIQRGYLGTHIRDGVLHFDPKPVGNLDGLSFPMRFRGTPLEVKLEENKLTVATQDDGSDRSIKVSVRDDVREIEAGESYTFGT
jgi:trehalose/maltose hydrolase-like predicted phosphorylase